MLDKATARNYIRANKIIKEEMSMERKIERITMHKGERSLVVEVCEDKERYEGQRVYISGSSNYYELDKLPAALAGCDRVERVIL